MSNFLEEMIASVGSEFLLMPLKDKCKEYAYIPDSDTEIFPDFDHITLI